MRALLGLTLRGLSLTLGILMLHACSDNTAPVKTVFDTQVDAVKKARAVDTKVEESAAQLRQTVDAATQSAPGQ